MLMLCLVFKKGKQSQIIAYWIYNQSNVSDSKISAQTLKQKYYIWSAF